MYYLKVPLQSYMYYYLIELSEYLTHTLTSPTMKGMKNSKEIQNSLVYQNICWWSVPDDENYHDSFFFSILSIAIFCKKSSTSCESFVICDWKNKPSTPAIWQIENYSTLSTPAGYQSPFTNNHFPCMGGVQKVKVRTTNHSGSNITL